MILSAFAVTIAALIFSIVYRKSKEMLCMCLWLCVMSVLLVISTMYSMKVGSYVFPFDIDRWLYNTFLKFRIHVIILSRLYNLSFSAFMICSVVFVSLCTHIKKRFVFLLLIPAILFSIINDHTSISHIYITAKAVESNNDVYSAAIQILNTVNIYIIYFYLLFPSVVFAFSFFTSKIFVKKRKFVVLFIAVTLVNIYFYGIFVVGKMSNIMVTNVDFARLPIKYDFDVHDYSLPSVLYMLMFVAVVYVMTFGNYAFKKSSVSKLHLNDENMLSENAAMTIHVYKNAFLAVRRQMKLIKMAIDRNDYAKIEHYANMCEELADEQLASILGTLGKLNNINNVTSAVEIISCIKDAIKRSGISESVKIEYNLACEHVYACGNYSDYSEMFINLFNNAIEAIEKAERTEKLINVNIISESDFFEIVISDNGCGIKADELTKIFKPFYSTKARLNYGGLGLSYVERVIKAYGGEIRVESIYGQGSTFHIAIPHYEDKRLKKLECF